MLLAERHESERLRQIIKELQRHRFGRKAESLPEEQMLLGLEDVQQVAACTEASQDDTALEGRVERARKRRNNCGALPTHLPRIEFVVWRSFAYFPHFGTDWEIRAFVTGIEERLQWPTKNASSSPGSELHSLFWHLALVAAY